MISILSTHGLYQFKKINEFVSIFPSREVYEVLGQSVTQIGTGLDCDLTVCATESWRILYKETKGTFCGKYFLKPIFQTEEDPCSLLY